MKGPGHPASKNTRKQNLPEKILKGAQKKRKRTNYEGYPELKRKKE